MSTPLWAKSDQPDPEMMRYTAGEDTLIDRAILGHDCVASLAHARMLEKIGFLSTTECQEIDSVLTDIYDQWEQDPFAIEIPTECEDGHTWLEQELVERIGEAGKKIHTGRSRNDQVATAVRLKMRQDVATLATRCLTLAEVVAQFGKAHAGVPLPGYTHLRRAMPSSVLQWALATSFALVEEAEACLGVWRRLDRCPLGGAAGFGVPLALDRPFVAQLLGFSQVQVSPVDVQNARGRMELAFLSQVDSVGLVLEKFLNDIWLFTSEEFGVFSLAKAFTTGSSIMPQKRNPDAVELMRATCREVRGLRATVSYLATGMSGSYHRDFQKLKGPTFRAFDLMDSTLAIGVNLMGALSVNEARCEAMMSDDLFATQAAVDLVRGGMSFRDAYRVIAEQVASGQFTKPRTVAETHLGSLGDEGYDHFERQHQAVGEEWGTHLFTLQDVRGRFIMGFRS